MELSMIVSNALIVLGAEQSTSRLLVSGIFFFGGCFALLVCLLAPGMVLDVKRTSQLEVENITDPLMEICISHYLEWHLEDEITAKNSMEILPLYSFSISTASRRSTIPAGTHGGPHAERGRSYPKREYPDRRRADKVRGERAAVLIPHTELARAEILAE